MFGQGGETSLNMTPSTGEETQNIKRERNVVFFARVELNLHVKSFLIRDLKNIYIFFATYIEIRA